MMSGGNCLHEAKTGKPCLSDFDVPVGHECNWCRRYIDLPTMASFADKHGLDAEPWDEAVGDHCKPINLNNGAIRS